MISKPKNNKTILIADASGDDLNRVGKFLRTEGFNILAAVDGKQALAIALNKHPHVILLATNMPGMDSFEVCRSIKKHCHVINTAVIMMAELADVSVMEKAFAAGARDFISKPFQMEELVPRIHSTLKLKEKPGIPGKKSDIKPGQKALLIEDNELNQSYVEAIVADMGFTVDIAENGEAGLEKFRTTKYDLVLTDINVPRINGIELTRIIRSQHSKDIPIIAISGHSEKELSDKCLAAGINMFVTKPFTTHELKAAINNLFYSPNVSDGRESFENVKNDGDETREYNYDQAIEIAKGDDDLLKKWMKRFQEVVRTGLENVNSCISANEYPPKSKVFHELVNYSGYFGLDELRSYIQELNSIQQFSNDKERIGNFYAKIRNELQKVQAFYESVA